MGKIEFAKIAGEMKLGLKKHSPEILTGVGIAGMVTSTVLAVKGTPKALILIEEKKRKEHLEKIKPVDAVKLTWKCYIPAAVTGVASVACLVGASSVNVRRNAALATAYSLSETALREYKNKVIETVGEKKEKEVRDAVAKERVEKDPVTTHEVIVTGNGNTLCYEALSGRYFYSSMDKIKRGVNVVNDRLLKENYISLNGLFDEVGLEPTKLGNELGWTIDQGMIDIDFSTQLSENDTPCLVLDYDRMPCYDFDRWL